jgi:hypothetical protein
VIFYFDVVCVGVVLRSLEMRQPCTYDDGRYSGIIATRKFRQRPRLPAPFAFLLLQLQLASGLRTAKGM